MPPKLLFTSYTKMCISLQSAKAAADAADAAIAAAEEKKRLQRQQEHGKLMTTEDREVGDVDMKVSTNDMIWLVVFSDK
jgi:hypothetical protein